MSTTHDKNNYVLGQCLITIKSAKGARMPLRLKAEAVTCTLSVDVLTGEATLAAEGVANATVTLLKVKKQKRKSKR